MSARMTHEEAVALFSDFFRGEHHIPGPKYKGENVREYEFGWCVLTDSDLSSFDIDTLTRLVLLAHDRAVRVEVESAMRYLRIAIWKRGREGGVNVRHPTIEQAIEAWRATDAGSANRVLP